MHDVASIKARLSDPRELARLLGLKAQRTRGGVLVPCPAHGNRSGSLGIRRAADGTIQVRCFGCSLSGDVLTLFAALEGDFRRGLELAEQLAGGTSPVPRAHEPEPERLAPGLYHELAAAILEAGRLDGRRCVREVEVYLASRRLLELARADGWAMLPPFQDLLAIARNVCEKARASHETAETQAASKASEQSGAFAFSPAELLIAAKLARRKEDGSINGSWAAWRLVVPWRGPDGRISALQRRRTWMWTPREGDSEPAKYVFPWAPEWPYGAERLGEDGTDSCHFHKNARLLDDCGGGRSNTKSRFCCNDAAKRSRSASEGQPRILAYGRRMIIVEGAVDALAARALGRGRVDVLGLPGIGSWRFSWAQLAAGRKVLVGLDTGKPRPSDGLIGEDVVAAGIALDCTGKAEEREGIIEAAKARNKAGGGLACVLCGAKGDWLCGGCGRRRARGKDWGEDWANRPGS